MDVVNIATVLSKKVLHLLQCRGPDPSLNTAGSNLAVEATTHRSG
jgi:hypothetical protein